MRPQKVLLVDGSRFLRDILKHVFHKNPDIEVIGELNSYRSLPATLRKKHPDWVIISLAPGENLPDDFRTMLLTEFPYLRVMGIPTDGSEVKIEWVSLQEKDFRGITLETLQNILNGVPDDSL